MLKKPYIEAGQMPKFTVNAGRWLVDNPATVSVATGNYDLGRHLSA